VTASLAHAAELIAGADALLIGAGAGMSVDAGIPAYRLNPPTTTARLSALVPMLFELHPSVAWGRAGAQLALFRRTAPHAGYHILHAWSQRMPERAFVLTSNVDGMFLATGFAADRVVEGHGSLHYAQCTRPCSDAIWPATPLDVDEAAELARDPLPLCRDCGAPARPNVFMFGDLHFNAGRATEQLRAYDAWQAATRHRRLAVVECGAGTAVPTIRNKCLAFARERGAPLIRINTAECAPEDGVIAIQLDALTALHELAARVPTARR
jgi:NAD-dependent SIR2 family protein deacetylase